MEVQRRIFEHTSEEPALIDIKAKNPNVRVVGSKSLQKGELIMGDLFPSFFGISSEERDSFSRRPGLLWPPPPLLKRR